MKRIIAIILALMLVLSLSITVFAADSDGTITINTTSKGTTYKIFRLMDLESFEKGKAYSYKINPSWNAFFTTGEGKDYIQVDEAGYVTWNVGEDETTKAEFAKKALAYAEACNEDDDPNNNIPVIAEHTTAADFAGPSVVFSGLELGWYLVDTTAGALCGLTTTDKNAVVNAKNHIPTADKQVQEDLDGMWGDENSADIGQIINYMTIIHAAAGAQNYILHDKMSEGLTFVHDTANGRGVTVIKHINSGGVETTLVEGTDYVVNTTDIADDCTFEVLFKKEFVASLKPNERLLVYYNAMLNRYALIADANTNESYLEYGEDHYTQPDGTSSYTFRFNIVKTDSSNQLLDGAKFKIYDAATGGNEIKVVHLMNADDTEIIRDENGNPVYRRARADEEGIEIEVKGGIATIVGFDNGVYYLDEIAAPAGYNKLTARKEFTIDNANLDATFTAGIYSVGSGVQVVNKTGSLLPETGAMGTAMFITFGMIVALGAGVLLVTKKRMGMIQE